AERFDGDLSQQETARAAGDLALRYRHDLVAVEHLTAAPHVVYNHLVHEQGIAAWRRAGTDPVARHDDGQRQRLWGALKYTLRIDGCVSRGRLISVEAHHRQRPDQQHDKDRHA